MTPPIPKTALSVPELKFFEIFENFTKFKLQNLNNQITFLDETWFTVKLYA